jgi:hypothetical protein
MCQSLPISGVVVVAEVATIATPVELDKVVALVK